MLVHNNRFIYRRLQDNIYIDIYLQNIIALNVKLSNFNRKYSVYALNIS